MQYTLKVVCGILKNTNYFMMALENIPLNRAKNKEPHEVEGWEELHSKKIV